MVTALPIIAALLPAACGSTGSGPDKEEYARPERVEQEQRLREAQRKAEEQREWMALREEWRRNAGRLPLTRPTPEGLRRMTLYAISIGRVTALSSKTIKVSLPSSTYPPSSKVFRQRNLLLLFQEIPKAYFKETKT
jgi:hypothetical protein